MWRISEEPFLRSPAARARRRWPRLARRPADVATIAPWQTLRGLGTRLPARPAPAHAARPLRDLLRLRSAPGARGAGHRAVRRAGVRLLVRPRRAAPARRWRWPSGPPSAAPSSAPAPRCAGCSSRAAGRPGSSWPTGERVPADVVVSDVDAAALYADLLPPARRRRRRPPRPGRATPSLSGFVLLLALRGRTPGLAHHTVLFPDGLRRGVRRRVRRGRGRAAPRPVADPTVYVSAPDDPALRPDEDSEAWFVLVNAPRHDPGRRGRLGRARAGRPVRRRRARRAGPARARRPRPGALVRGPDAGRPRPRHRQRRRLDLRHVEQRRPAPRSCARPTPRRCPGCSWSAAPPTRAAGCRWWRCRPRSSRASSAPPDPASADPLGGHGDDRGPRGDRLRPVRARTRPAAAGRPACPRPTAPSRPSCAWSSRSKCRLKNCGAATVVTRNSTPPGASSSAIVAQERHPLGHRQVVEDVREQREVERLGERRCRRRPPGRRGAAPRAAGEAPRGQRAAGELDGARVDVETDPLGLRRGRQHGRQLERRRRTPRRAPAAVPAR